jgi:O-antigen/teichoic acid export membrane protein
VSDSSTRNWSLARRIRARQLYLPPARGGEGIGTRVARGTMWSGVGVAAGALLQLARSMVFARLLMPADFGIVNLAAASTQFVLIFANFGFAASVVHHENLERRDLATIWWGNVAVDAAAALACCLVALISDQFTDHAKLLPIVALLALQFVLTSLGSVNAALMLRTFKFREAAVVEFAGAVTTFVVGFTLMKVFHWGVYGLVTGMVVATAVMSAMNIAYLPWLPSFRFCRESLRRHVKYGRWFLGVNLTTYVNVSADRFIIAKMLSTTQLGFYEYAGNIPMQVVSRISQVLNGVVFTTFASVQNSPAEVSALLHKFYRYNSLLTFPILVGIALVAPEFVVLAYGDTWAPIVPSVRLFCLYGVLLLYVQPMHSICNGVGLQHLPMRWMLIYLPINLVLILAGAHLGRLNGVVLARSAMPIFVVFTLGAEVMRRVNVPWRSLLVATVPSMVSCLAMSAAVLGLDRLLVANKVAMVPHLVLSTLLGGGTYVGMLLLFWREDLMEIRQFVLPKRSG